MKKILHLAWNDIKIEFADRSTVLFFFILPLVFTALLGASMRGPDPDADNRFVVLVVDEDQSDLSANLIAELENSAVVRPELTSQSQANLRMADGDAAIILVLHRGLESELGAGRAVQLELIKSPNDPNTLAMEQAIYTATGKVGGAILAAINAVNAAEKSQSFADEAARQVYFADSLKIAREAMATPFAVSEVTQAPAAARTSMNSFELSSAGQLVTWTMITLLGASEVFVNERIGGTLRRLLSTPTAKATVLLGKITGRLGMGMLQMAVLILVGALVFKVNWGNSPLALALVVIAFGLAAIALGVMLGAFAKTRSQASGLTVMFSMVMAALGGAWWQIEITPPVYQSAVKILPTTWAMQGFNRVIVRGGGPADVLLEVGILLGFALLFFVIGMRRLRFE